MTNQISLKVEIKSIDTLRFTPSGIAILTMWLYHESWQLELNERFLAKMDIQAKVLGDMADTWPHKLGDVIEVHGFMTQKSFKNPRPIIHIQHTHYLSKD